MIGKIYATIYRMIDLREYLDHAGRNLFGDWFHRLNAEAARRVTTSSQILPPFFFFFFLVEPASEIVHAAPG